MLSKILLFRTYDFRKGILFAVLGFSLFITGNYLFPNSFYGICMAMGILLSAISDVPGTKKHNLIGIVIGIVLGAISFTIIQLTRHSPIPLGFFITILVFGNAFICSYGLRASMVSFSGLLAIALGFIDTGSTEYFYLNTLAILVGSLVYIIVSSIINMLSPKQLGDQLLMECMQLTAEYLRTRGQLLNTTNRAFLFKKLLELQIVINDKHENIRAIILRENLKTAGSGYHRRQMLMFIELVDILELAVANPVNYEDLKERFTDNEVLFNAFVKLLNSSADFLIDLSYKLPSKSFNYKPTQLADLISEMETAIEKYKQNNSGPNRRENVILLRNIADYEKKQVNKLETIQHIFANNYDWENIKSNKNLEPQKFITNEDYSLKRLKDNFNFNSIIFKHSLRLTLAILTGFIIGTAFHFQNTYWILITILVIMRPNYGITKKRTFQRVIGTLIGTAISFIILYFTQNTYIYIATIFIAMIFAFAYIQQNYKLAAIFITINIIMVFSMLADNPFGIMSARIVDTFIGAGIAILFNYFFWPVWEVNNIKGILSKSLDANKSYMSEVASLYINKQHDINSYKLSRKNAFIQIGNLHAAFQRMAQEPKSKQTNISDLYEIVALQHTFLSSAAALGTFIQNHRTTDASQYFSNYINSIINNINKSHNQLSNNSLEIFDSTEQIKQANEHFSGIFRDLNNKRELELKQGQIQISKHLRENLQEIKLMYDQLNYLYEISEKLTKNITSIT